MCSRLKQRASKSACFVVPPLFRADSGTNLIMHGENVKGRPYGSVAQLAECLHGKPEALGRVPFGPRCYPPLVTQTFSNLKVRTYNKKSAASDIFIKRKTFVSLFPSLDRETSLNYGLFCKERICSSRRKFFPGRKPKPQVPSRIRL